MSYTSLSASIGGANSVNIYGSSQAEPERMLWVTVLQYIVHDLFDLRVVGKSHNGEIILKSRDCEIAERWVGTFPSRDFNEVCALAGMNGTAVHERLRRILALPDKTRAEFSYMTLGERAGELWQAINTFEAQSDESYWMEARCA
jgi:hypothetical protein